jgi:hypothetical protein
MAHSSLLLQIEALGRERKAKLVRTLSHPPPPLTNLSLLNAHHTNIIHNTYDKNYRMQTVKQHQ